MERKRSSKPFSDVSLLYKGFLSQKKELYPLNKYNYCFFISDWEIEFYIQKINPPDLQKYLNDKLYFHLLLKREYNPQFIGIIDAWGFKSFSEYKNLQEGFQTFGRLICKPTMEAGGKGVKYITNESECKVDRPYVIESPIISHAYSYDIYPESLNTIRVVTIRDNKGAYIAGAAHRFGTSKTGHIDNFSKGGIAAYIDLESGEMAEARSYSGFYSNSYHENHPDTKKPIQGVKVPSWEEIKRFTLNLSDLFPNILCVGWDIALTPDRVVVVEGNAGTHGLAMIQAKFPFLLNLRTVNFMLSKAVISRKKAEFIKNILHD